MNVTLGVDFGDTEKKTGRKRQGFTPTSAGMPGLAGRSAALSDRFDMMLSLSASGW